MHVRSPALIDFAALGTARDRIAGQIRATPLFAIPLQAGGRTAWVKAENTQLTGSFKVRGALNAILTAAEQGATGFVTYSAGNHGRGVAHAAQLATLPAVIVMPNTSTANKISLTRQAGAEVIVCAPDEIVTLAHAIAADRGFTFIHPFDNADVIAGQGTVGLELLAQLDQSKLDTVLVPVGGGGLLSGIAIAVRQLRPDVKIIGVEPELAGDLAESFHAGKLIAWDRTRTRQTLADGLRSPQVGELPWAHITALVDDVLTITEERLIEAVRSIATHTNTLVEPSAAVAFAAVLQHAEQFAGEQTAVVATGGNISPADFAALF